MPVLSDNSGGFSTVNVGEVLCEHHSRWRQNLTPDWRKIWKKKKTKQTNKRGRGWEGWPLLYTYIYTHTQLDYFNKIKLDGGLMKSNIHYFDIFGKFVRYQMGWNSSHFMLIRISQGSWGFDMHILQRAQKTTHFMNPNGRCLTLCNKIYT